MNKQIDTIERLDENDLKELTRIVINKLGYKLDEVLYEGKILKCRVKAGISTIETYIIITTEHLSGKINTEDLDNLIEEFCDTTIIVSNRKISKGFKDKLRAYHSSLDIDFIGRDDLIDLINKYEIDYWRHKDTTLLNYEKYIIEEISKDTQLKKISTADKQIERLKSIFIDPIIYELQSDKESHYPSRKKINLDNISDRQGVSIISGEAGIGKTTILKKLIKSTIQDNETGKHKILASNLIESEYSVSKAINKEIEDFFEDDLKELVSHYCINVYIDSIDEFHQSIQDEILNELIELNEKFSYNFFCATRSYDQLVNRLEKGGVNAFNIQKFGNEQIELFVTKFFKSDMKKGEYLLDALRDKRIIEKLPMTPLTMSLISILFEEREFEIPATITDIYDSFNTLILGKSTVTHAYDFIDINFKQRVLTYYAYKLLNNKDHEPLSKPEFLELIKDFYQDRTISIDREHLEEVLESLIDNSGILSNKKGDIIFKHDSFMEYYASIEYFNYRREEEEDLIKNFNENHWQNTAIFYAGRTKDMSSFLIKLNQHLEKSSNIHDLFNSIMGIGFILQALYETDSKPRGEAVQVALENLVKIHSILTKLASDDPKLFKDHKYPALSSILYMVFYDHFNSITLKDPLKLAFQELEDEFLETTDETKGFKILLLAVTLASERLNSSEELERLIFDSDLLNRPILALIAHFSIDLILDKKYKEFQKEAHKQVKRLQDPVNVYLQDPVNKLRFTPLDLISPDQKVQLYFEGVTDGELVEHAFYVLTGGDMPYWNLTSPKSGGAELLAKRLYEIDEIVHEDEKIHIGIFDNDSKGIQEFKGGLKEKKFDYIDKKNNRVKKHKNRNIYGIKLPIPPDMQHYIKEEQVHNYFAIEHYLPHQFLLDNEVIKETSIPGIFKVKSSFRKKSLLKKVRKIKDPEFFSNFICLFDTLDRISEVEINYKNV